MRVGILGAGQLGQMLALAGHPLGLRFSFYDDVEEPRAASLGEYHRGPFVPGAALEHFCAGLDRATYEFENVPYAVAEYVASRVPLLPSLRALQVASDRGLEKALFQECGIPVGPYRLAQNAFELKQALQELTLPCVVKTTRLGYDGKGQVWLHSTDEAVLSSALDLLTQGQVIVEEVIPFDQEISLIAARSDSATVFYEPTRNTHRQGVLHKSEVPCGLSLALQRQAEDGMTALLDALDYRGVLAVEFFQVGETLYANEIAPRVHNSGHWTKDGAVTSQFENHLRAILNWPLGSPQRIFPHVSMENILGTLPQTVEILQDPCARLSLYGKAERPGRKLGHINRVRMG